MKKNNLTIDNAEVVLQKLQAGENSDDLDVIAIACAALKYYINKEELLYNNRVADARRFLKGEEV